MPFAACCTRAPRATLQKKPATAAARGAANAGQEADGEADGSSAAAAETEAEARQPHAAARR